MHPGAINPAQEYGSWVENSVYSGICLCGTGDNETELRKDCLGYFIIVGIQSISLRIFYFVLHEQSCHV